MGKEPKYEVLKSYGAIELRLYQPFLVAEVVSFGNRKEAIRRGFRVLADYLFGNNRSSKKMPMSIPVTQQKIGEGWRIRFMLTHETDLNALPVPESPQIKLLLIPEMRVGAIRFSGIATDSKIEQYQGELASFALSKKWTLDHHPIYAFYNPPWTLPFLRRNEVLFEILKIGS